MTEDGIIMALLSAQKMKLEIHTVQTNDCHNTTEWHDIAFEDKSAYRTHTA